MLGALIALEAEGDQCEDFCIPESIIYAAAATGTTGMAFGVHLGNARRGDFLLDLVTAGGVWAAGFVVLVTSSEGIAGPLAVAIPVVQLAATVAVERGRGRAKEARRTQLLIVPRGDGRIALGARVSF